MDEQCSGSAEVRGISRTCLRLPDDQEGPDGGSEISLLDIHTVEGKKNKKQKPSPPQTDASISTDVFGDICSLFVGQHTSQRMTYPSPRKVTTGSTEIHERS